MGEKRTTYALTSREKQIGIRLLKFEKRSTIAAGLGLNIRTVDYHLSNLRRKVFASSLAELTLRIEKLNGLLKGH